MRATWCCVSLLCFVSSPVWAQPPHSRAQSIPGAIESAAVVRIAAPFGIVTSTFRTVEHNRAVGGVPDSYHLLGRAIDIVRRHGVTHAQIAAALTAAGFHLIESLDEGDHSHFAFGSAVQSAKAIIPPPAPLPRAPQVAADEHGMLRADLASSWHSAGVATSKR